MQNQTSISGRLLIGITALAAWFAVIGQFYLNIKISENSLGETITRYFSYFTILSNIMVAICSTAVLLNPGRNIFSRPKTMTAVAVYILIVGIVYNLVLRNIWAPTGFQKLLDEMLHVGTPLLFVLNWFLFVPKYELQWKDTLPWLSFPLIYCCFILIRGAASGFYPYPFMDVTAQGYQQVAINSTFICAAFLFVSFLFILIGKFTGKRS